MPRFYIISYNIIMVDTFYLEKNKNNFAEILGKYNYNFNNNDIVVGAVIGIENTGVLVDIGANISAYLPLDEISITDIKHPNEILTIGEIREFLILSSDLVRKKIIISIEKLEYLKAWEKIKQLNSENSTIYNVEFDNYNKGGMQVNLEGLKGFIPNSHLPKIFSSKFLPVKYIPIRFLEVDEKSNNLLLSSRAAFLQKQINNLELGQTVKGCVVDIKPFGVLINVLGIRSLLHISEISFKRIENLKQLFQVGDFIDVIVIYIDSKKQRVFLSSKYL
jgi:small subunit ribosomal protein S1